MQRAPSDTILRIRLSVPTAPDREFSIRKQVIRVGSSPDCEVYIPVDGIAVHALTLQREQQTLTVIVRSAQSVSISGKLVTTGETPLWATGESLQVDGLATLHFEFVADIKPQVPSKYSPPPQNRDGIKSSIEPANHVTPLEKPQANFDLKVLVESVALLFVGVAFYFLLTGDMDRFMKSLGNREALLSHSTLIEKVDERIKVSPEGLTTATDRFWLETREQLQVAYRFEKAANTERARAVYRNILAKLLERASIASNETPIEEQKLNSTLVSTLFRDPLERNLAEFLIAKN